MPHPPTPKKSAEKTHLVTGGNICLMLEQFEQQQTSVPSYKIWSVAVCKSTNNADSKVPLLASRITRGMSAFLPWSKTVSKDCKTWRWSGSPESNISAS